MTSGRRAFDGYRTSPEGAAERAAPTGRRATAALTSSSRVTGVRNAALARQAAMAQHVARRAVMPKLAVSHVDDPMEREAEAMAARVVTRGVARAPSVSPAGPVEAERAEADAEEPATEEPQVSPELEAMITGASGGDQLPAAVRERIEPHLGADLTGVRLHAGPPAAMAAAALRARAFTYGKNIFLAEGESPTDIELMAHEATHVVQQQAVEVYRNSVMRQEEEEEDDSWIPDWILEGVSDAASAIPGYTLLTELTGKDPITDERVSTPRQSLVEDLLTYLPGTFATAVGPLLTTIDVLGDVFTLISDGLAAHNLTLERLASDIGKAWDEFSVTNGIDGNVEIVERYIGALVDDVEAFIGSIIDAVIDAVRAVVAEVAEPLLETDEVKPVWDLTKKVLHYDPLRGESVDAPTVEILGDFLRLIKQESVLAQMQERGTLQETADWLDTQFDTFKGLVGELGSIFADAWAAIAPQNLPNLLDNLASLAQRVFAFIGGVADFAATVIGKVLELVKSALLGWLSDYAHEIPGFHLLTVILERNPFTGEAVPRTPENLIRGFISLLPGGDAMYDQLAESGVIGDAAARIESEMGRLGISWEMVTGIFLGIWDLVTLESLLNPPETFGKILDLFGEPLGRIVEFIGVVVQVVLTLILALMNFPSDILGSIIANTMQAIDDIMKDPIGFLINMLEAVKTGFLNFLDKIAGYLLQGLTDWLFRGLGSLGIQPPADLSLESVLGLVLQVLGVTEQLLWEKLAAQIGQERVDQIRSVLDQLTGAWAFIKDVQERGLVAIWEYVADKLGNLWDTILSMAQDWILSEIIDKVVTKLLSMLDPTGVMAVINSFTAFFNAIQSAIEYLREILEIVNTYVSTLAAVAAGNIAPGADMLEGGLAAAIPVAIGFLANQVGLANVPEKIVEIIEGLRELIDQALDWLFEQAMRLGQAALSALGIGESGAPAQAPDDEASSGVEAGKIPAGLPPEEVKRLILGMARSALTAGDVQSVPAMHARLDAIAAANLDRGLHSLSISFATDDSMSMQLEAAASPTESVTLAWSDIFSPSEIDTNADLEGVREELRRAGMSSFAALAIDGEQVGSLSESGGGLHAEEGLVRGPEWETALQAAQERVSSGADMAVITLLINRTPCVSCVAWLKDAIKDAQSRLGSQQAKVQFRLAARGTYQVRAVLTNEDLDALWAGVHELVSDPNKKKSYGRSFDEVYKEELENWKEDLRSSSTEWVDPETGTYIASGLAELEAAGWRVFGLDAGQPVTPRQLNLRTRVEQIRGAVPHVAS